jgi:putative glutamine amidotransferase
MKRPLIGVTPDIHVPEFGATDFSLREAYADALLTLGATPVLLFPTETDGLTDVLPLLDGVLFTGGVDVDPATYGAERSPLCGKTVPRRDAFERELFSRFFPTGKPILGICRGMQILNALRGGTLYQDIPTECALTSLHCSSVESPAFHGVSVLEGTPLSALFPEGGARVNSFHHQAVRSLSPAFLPMALSDDGVLEALYDPRHPFLWAVQWHPERIFREEPLSRRILAAFIEAARHSTD